MDCQVLSEEIYKRLDASICIAALMVRQCTKTYQARILAVVHLEIHLQGAKHEEASGPSTDAAAQEAEVSAKEAEWETSLRARIVRTSPIGLDRYHRRYWRLLGATLACLAYAN